VRQLLQSEAYNAANFTNGVHAAAALIIKSGMNRDQFQHMDKQLRQMMSGAQNAHRLAVIQMDPSKDEAAQLLPFSSSNKDMEFSMWISWLLKIVCAAYQMDPAEINYIYGNEGQRSALGNQDPSDRVASSRERGLKPLLKALERWLNQSIIWKLDPDFRVEFFGLSDRAPLVEAELKIKSLAHRSINEVRAQDDDPPIDHWSCNIPANPLVFAAIEKEMERKHQAEQAQAQAAAQAAAAQPAAAAPSPAPALPAPGAPQDMTHLPEDLPESLFADEGGGSQQSIELSDLENPGRGTPGIEFTQEDMHKSIQTVARMYGLNGDVAVDVLDLVGRP
jgi:hypothetical protein